MKQSKLFSVKRQQNQYKNNAGDGTNQNKQGAKDIELIYLNS